MEEVLKELKKIGEMLSFTNLRIGGIEQEIGGIDYRLGNVEREMANINFKIGNLEEESISIKCGLKQSNEKSDERFNIMCDMFDNLELHLTEKIMESKAEVYKEIRKYHPSVADEEENYNNH